MRTLLVVALAVLTGCGSMTFVEKTYGPDRGGVITWKGSGEAKAYTAMTRHCSPRAYEVLDEKKEWLAETGWWQGTLTFRCAP